MGKKKPFINKKTASTYHMVRRSQRDVGGYYDELTGEPVDVPSEFILMPSPETERKLLLQQKQQQQNKQHPQHKEEQYYDDGMLYLHDIQEEQSEQEEQDKEDYNAKDYNDEDEEEEDEEENTNHKKNTESTAFSIARQKLVQAGLVDNYDYNRHLRPITGTGIFLANPDNNTSTTTINPLNDVRSISRPALDIADIQELDRQFDSIALTADCMDEDIARALFDEYEDGEYEEILDDFCITAAQDQIDNDDDDDDEMEESEADKALREAKKIASGLFSPSNPDFDFDRHIEQLIMKARLESNGGGKIVPKDHEWWMKNESEFHQMKPLKNRHNDDDDDDNYSDEDNDHHHDFNYDNFQGEEDSFYDQDDDDYNLTIGGGPGIVPKLNPDEERALCEKFEQTLLEYDSDEVGDLDGNQDIAGNKPMEGDAQIDNALDSFLEQLKDEKIMFGTSHLPENKRTGGGSHVLVGRKRVPIQSVEVEQQLQQEQQQKGEEEKLEDVLAEADEYLANPEMDLPPEEILIDGKSYFTMKERNPWDCESILSTYSNLDNNPAVIGRSKRRNNNKKSNHRNRMNHNEEKSLPQDEQPVQILLSNKTGLPLGVYPTTTSNHPPYHYDDEHTFASVNRGEARRKNETKEEKKARKEAVKEERQIARLQKKYMREAISDEFRKRSGGVGSDDVAGKTVFKFS